MPDSFLLPGCGEEGGVPGAAIRSHPVAVQSIADLIMAVRSVHRAADLHLRPCTVLLPRTAIRAWPIIQL